MKYFKPLVGIMWELLFCSFFIVLGFVFSFIILIILNPVHKEMVVEFLKGIF